MHVTAERPKPDVTYPESDGQPMADNTVQFRWIQTIQGNLDAMFRNRPDVFVAGDNLIYPVRGDNTIRQAPDVYVAFGRPKGDRGSYRVWEEGDVFPQAIFEIRSPGNRLSETARKLLFYDEYGVEEYYDYDPARNVFLAYLRRGGELDEVASPNGLISPRLGIRFDTSGPELVIYRPDGRRFLSTAESEDRADRQADEASREIDRLRAKLRAAGLDPDAP